MKSIDMSVIFLLIIFAVPAFASVKDDVKKGNLLYNNKNYADAARIYEEAVVAGSVVRHSFIRSGPCDI